VTSPFAELNPNQYLQSSVVVPSCTSDLFAGAGGSQTVAGAGFSFGGAAVVEATLRALFSSLLPFNAARADSVVLVGGAGVLALVDKWSALLLSLKREATRNGSAVLDVFAVCDGDCLLLPDVPAFLPQQELCTRDDDCPPALSLPKLDAFSGGLARPGWCTLPEVWRCYAAPALLESWARSATPVLLIAPQYDASALRAYGADAPLQGLPLAWAQREYAPAVRRAAAAARFAFSAACERPASAQSKAWYRTLVARDDKLAPAALTAALAKFISASASGGSDFGRWLDDCAELEGCNPSGCNE